MGEGQLEAAGILVRPMADADYDEVHALWLRCAGMGLNDVDDSREGIARLLARNPETCLVAETVPAGGVCAAPGDDALPEAPAPDRRVVGCILVGFDGRRAYVYHTAVDPDSRGEGIGRALVEAELAALGRLGVSKVALVAFSRNAGGNAFWERMGFGERHDLSYRDLALVRMVRTDT